MYHLAQMRESTNDISLAVSQVAARKRVMGFSLCIMQLRALLLQEARSMMNNLVLLFHAMLGGVICGAVLALLLYIVSSVGILPQNAPDHEVVIGSYSNSSRFSNAHELAFSPGSDALVTRTMQIVADQWGVSRSRLRSFNTSTEMELYALNHPDTIGAAVLFESSSAALAFRLATNESWVEPNTAWNDRGDFVETPNGTRYVSRLNAPLFEDHPKQVVTSDPCPIDALKEYPSLLCSGLLSLQQRVSAAIPAALEELGYSSINGTGSSSSSPIQVTT